MKIKIALVLYRLIRDILKKSPNQKFSTVKNICWQQSSLPTYVIWPFDVFFLAYSVAAITFCLLPSFFCVRNKIVLNTESDVAQMAKLLAKQVAVVSVNTLMLQEQAAV